MQQQYSSLLDCTCANCLQFCIEAAYRVSGNWQQLQLHRHTRGLQCMHSTCSAPRMLAAMQTPIAGVKLIQVGPQQNQLITYCLSASPSYLNTSRAHAAGLHGTLISTTASQRPLHTTAATAAK